MREFEFCNYLDPTAKKQKESYETEKDGLKLRLRLD